MIDAADNATHLLPVTCGTRLHFADATHGTFTADLGQDLLGDWVLTLSWSGGPLRGGKRMVVDGHEAGLQMLKKIAQHKERSGFRLLMDYHV